jgi:hypothetical protein
MPKAEYLALPGAEPYEFPVQRPDIPDYANAGDEAERDQWTKLYDNENRQYSEAQGLKLLLKAQLIQAVPIIYISTLQHPVFMFTNVSVLRILTFLKANYGAISTDDLGTNQEKLMAPWDPNTPIQTVFTTGEACRHFAETGGKPINHQGLYLLPTHNTIDVDEYIERANQARFAVAATAISEQSEQRDEPPEHPAEPAIVEQAEPEQ